MKKLFIAAAILLAIMNVSIVRSAKAESSYLVIPSHYGINGMYQPTIVRRYTDINYASSEAQCIYDLTYTATNFPWSMCTKDERTVRLFTRLY